MSDSTIDKVYAARDIEQAVHRLRDLCRVTDYFYSPHVSHLVDGALEACEIIEQLCSYPSASRENVIEECAQVCNETQRKALDERQTCATGADCARAIRALMHAPYVGAQK